MCGYRTVRSRFGLPLSPMTSRFHVRGLSTGFARRISSRSYRPICWANAERVLLIRSLSSAYTRDGLSCVREEVKEKRLPPVAHTRLLILSGPFASSGVRVLAKKRSGNGMHVNRRTPLATRVSSTSAACVLLELSPPSVIAKIESPGTGGLNSVVAAARAS